MGHVIDFARERACAGAEAF